MCLRRIGRALLLLSFLVAGVGCRQPAAESQPTPTPIPTPVLPTQQVRRGEIAEEVQLVGRVVPVRQEDLYFRVGGRLQRLHMHEGDFVQEKQLLAELDTGDLTNRLAKARVSLDLAELRLTELRRQGQEEAQSRDYSLKRARLNLEMAQLRLAEAQKKSQDIHRDSSEAARKAEINLAIAQLRLKEAEGKVSLSQPASAAQISRAELSLETAKLKLAQAQEAAETAAARYEQDLLTAKTSLDKARVELELAQASYDRVSWRPDIGRLSQARALQMATLNYELALANYEGVSKGRPTDTSVELAANAVKLAEVGLEEAKSGADTSDYQLEILRKNVELWQLEVEQALAALKEDKNYELELLGRSVELSQLEVERLTSQPERSALELVEQEKHLQLAQLEMERLEKTQSDMQIVAPFAGQILRVFPEVGETMEGFKSVMALADSTSLEIGVEARGEALASIQVGQEAIIILNDFPTHSLVGKVRKLASYFSTSTVAGQSQDRLVRISVEEMPEDVKWDIGMLARITIIVRRREDTLIIPRTALQTRHDTFWVEIMEGGIIRRVPVKAGIMTDTEAEILSGLEDGQVIIVR